MTKPKSLTLNITQKIIDEAVPLNSSKCMIAQAVRHAGGSSVHVTAETVRFNLGETRFTYDLPPKAVVELYKFEEDKHSVQPFRVVLDGRGASSRPVRHHAGKRGPTKKKHQKSAPRRTVRRFHGLRIIEVPTSQ
jgi:hypothetical protein